uniref:LRR binding FLII interacting protein 1 n=1 Tax=Gorilla gorilla gorilla TaxID=9595 RepID=A0A2I2YSP4_GORGO
MTSPAATQSREIYCLSPEARRMAEVRLAAKRAALAEAREIPMKELERQQKEVEERPEKYFTEKGSRNMPGLSAATLAFLGGTSSLRGSGDTSISIDTEASIREIKDSLAEVEEKYKKVMFSNAQLDNEKTNFIYQVDPLKDMLLELEEQLAESRRQYEEKNKEFEREKHAHSILQFQFAEVKEALKQTEEMLEKHGIILNSEIVTNGETSDTLSNVGYQDPTKMTKEELNALKSTGDGTLGKPVKMKSWRMWVKEISCTILRKNNTQRTQYSLLVRMPRTRNPLKTLLSQMRSWGAPDDRTRTPLEPSNCWSDLDGGSHTENVGEAAVTQVGEQADTVASCPSGHSDDTVNHDDRCMVEVPQELETSIGHSLEKEFTNQEAAEPKEVPVQSTEAGRDHNEEEGEEKGLRDEKPIKTEVPGSPAGTESKGQEATGPSTVDTQSEPSDMKEPDEEKNDQQGEKRLKMFKKMKLRKKSKVKSTDRKSAVEAQNEVTENPKQKIAAESSENVDCPENPKMKLDGKLDQEGNDVKTAAEEVLAGRDTLDFEDVTVQSSGPRAGGEELDEGVAKDNAKIDEPESEDADRCTLPKNETESTERCGMSEHPSQTIRKALDSNSLKNDDLLAPGGEPGDFNPESREDTRGGNEKGKSKEDRTMS